MLKHAWNYFDIVLFYIDKDNFRSQKAIEKLGGQRIFGIDGKPLELRPTASIVYAIEK